MSAQTSKKLEDLRAQIDALDESILLHLQERAKIVKLVSEEKEKLDIDPHQPGRYEAMLEALVMRASKLGLDADLVRNIWDAIHQDSIRQQTKHRS